MKLSDAITKLNADRTDEVALAVLREKVGDHVALYLRNGKIDYTETREAIDHCVDTGEPAPGCISLAEWLAQGAKERKACPVTGKALLKGLLRVERPNGLPPKNIDWGSVSEDLQLVVAYRAEIGECLDPLAAHDAVSSSKLTLEWQRASEDWRELTMLERPSPGQKALLERVRERLIFRKKEELKKKESVSEQTLSNDRNPIPHLIVLYDQEDSKHAQRLKTWLVMLERSGKVKVSLLGDVIRPGCNTEHVLNDALEKSAAIVHLVSAVYLESDLYRKNAAKFAGKQNIPVMLSPCLTEATIFSHLVPLPGGGRWISSYANKDEAWYDVAVGFREAISRLVP